jgi:hypothetical protein
MGEPDRSHQETPGPVAHEGPGAGATSPRAAPLATPMLAPRITKSRNEPSVSSLGMGPVPSTSMLAAPSDAPSALGISCTGASHASGVGSSGARVSRSATTDRGESGGTMARSPTLTTDDATRGKYGDVARCVVGRQTIGDEEV